MKFAITVPNATHVAAITQPWQRTLGSSEIARTVRLADELGYAKITVSEHYLMPEEHLTLSGGHWPDATTTLAFVAAHAPRVTVASSVSLVALQNPIVQAKRWATLDWLSGGRAQMHVGVGWLKDEFDILGVDFAKRGRITDEYIRALIALWTLELPSFEGEYISFPPIGAEPRPVQTPHIPFVFGGGADSTLRRVAKWGVGWSPFLLDPIQYPEKLDYIRSHRDYDGRPIEVHLGLGGLKLEDEHRPSHRGGEFDTWEAQQLIDQLNGLAELGVTHATMVVPPVRDLEQYLDRLRWEAEEIFPKVG